MILLCITNEIPGRGCTIRGEHLSTCDGTNRHGSECTGCLPRPAETGLLCRSCWERFEAALGKAVDLVTHLRSIEKGPLSLVPTHSAPGSRVILPGSWMEGDALWVLLAGVAIAHAKDTRSLEPVWRLYTSIWDGFSLSASLDEIALAVRELVAWVSVDPRNIVSRAGGAEAAVEFFREVQRALAMFPLDEPRKRATYLRCRTCGQFTMLDRPPLEYLDERVMECINPACGALYDPQLATFDMRLLAQQIRDEREDLAADLVDQVEKLLSKPAVTVKPVAAISGQCAHEGHNECLLDGCGCRCHSRAGFGAATPVRNEHRPVSFPPSSAVQDPATCPRCWLVHPEGECTA